MPTIPTDSIKISQLTAASTPLNPTDQIPVNQAGATKRANDSDVLVDWRIPTSGSITAAVYNGNGNYDLTTDTDYTSYVSPGMRFRSTRTVASPTQCTLLNGTTQYYSKSTPAGTTFTDDFVGGFWIKPTSYSATDMSVISRYNGTSGWDIGLVATTGQLYCSAFNAGSANRSSVVSFQSPPLNRWSFCATQLDMSAFTASTTTSYVMFNGLDVPATVSRAGTNPTALVQAGNLEVGSRNAGTQFFPGRIAQAFYSNAKITQANVRTLQGQGLTSALITANNIVSAFSFSNSINDLNTTTANNLTAVGSAVATNADSFAGGQAGGTISSTLDYGIVHKITSTTINVQAPEGCTFPTSGGISAFAFSSVNGYGFPRQKGKWQLRTDIRASLPLGITAATWYSGASTTSGSFVLNHPLGEWQTTYDVTYYTLRSGVADNRNNLVTMSSTTSTESDKTWTSFVASGLNSSSAQFAATHTRSLPVSASVLTPYYILAQSLNTITGQEISTGGLAPSFIIADNAYLAT